MSWKDFFRKKPTDAPDPLKDLTLSKLQVGYFVDFDMKTWEVTAKHYYDWGSGVITHEWQLKSVDETIYLERASDDEDEWSISRKIPIGRLGSGIKEHINAHEDPPGQIVFEDTTFYLDESAGGHFHKDGKGPGQELIAWDYIDESEKKYLSIEQWGETDFEASVGEAVEDYQFTNILPTESKED